ncbi:MAG: cell division protein ZapA [Elusimicrobiales bacterium]|nr:cell division protein ZapA [Elusimicrobiales bacterium]MCK5582150.1 cell division protein ZapA [Elusimicrobiales bacterium]
MANKHEIIVKIRGRQFNIAIEGLTPIEISTLANQVEEKMKHLEEKTNTIDTSKLAVLAAIDYASELYNLRQKTDVNTQANERKIDKMVGKLQKTLDKELF